MKQTCDVEEEPNQVHEEAAAAVVTVVDLPSCLRFLAFSLKIYPCSRKFTNINILPSVDTVDTKV